VVWQRKPREKCVRGGENFPAHAEAAGPSAVVVWACRQNAVCGGWCSVGSKRQEAGKAVCAVCVWWWWWLDWKCQSEGGWGEGVVKGRCVCVVVLGGVGMQEEA